MKIMIGLLSLMMTAVTITPMSSSQWYLGDEHCPPPADDGRYSAPYNPLDHPTEYPTFQGADKPGWSCSYQRSDGVIIQFGDSRTPQEQWLGIWGNRNLSDN